MTNIPLLLAAAEITAEQIGVLAAWGVTLAASLGVCLMWRRSYLLGLDFFGPRDVQSECVRPWGQVAASGFLGMLFVGVVIFLFLRKDLQQVPAQQTPTERIEMQLHLIHWSVAGNLVTLAIVLGFSYWQFRITAGEVVPWRGLIPNRRDLRNGILLGVACVPLLLLLQGLLQYLSRLFFQEQTEHPYIEMIRENKDLDRTLIYELMGWVTFSVMVIAPLLEEILFRGLLQGWLRARYRAMTDKMLERPAGAQNERGSVTSNPSSPSQLSLAASRAEIQRQRLTTWAPIFITSMAFTMAHATHGPATIPIFFFSLALGYAYEKTGRLAPSIIAHSMLNLTTTIMLWLLISGRIPAE